MRTLKLKWFGPVALLAALSLAIPGCGGSDDGGDSDGAGDAGDAGDGGADAGGDAGGDTDDPSAGDEFEDAVIDVDSLLIGDSDGQALTADGLRASLSDAREYVNALLTRAFGNLKALAVAANVTELSKGKPNFRQWQAMGHDGATEYQLNVVRIGVKLFAYGLKARQGDGEFTRVLWGAFAKQAVRRGAGRIHADFTAWKGVKDDLNHDGQAEFRFINAGNRKVVAFGAKGLVTPRNENPVNGVFQFWKGNLGKRAFRYVREINVLGGDAKEWVGARAVYKLGTGGFMQALITGGDVPADSDPITARGCWKDGDWIFLTSDPEGLFDNATGEVGACLEEFKAAGGSPPDPTADPADAEADWDMSEDFAIEGLPSGDDADKGEDEPPAE